MQHALYLKALENRKEQSLYRVRKIRDSFASVKTSIDKKPLISFCSNNYLGLSENTEVIAAFKQGADNYGLGSGASALLGGYSSSHKKLEEALAAFLGYEAALVFSSGYMANVGIITTLVSLCKTFQPSHPVEVYEDRLNHASLLDGALFSGARFIRYEHTDCLDLEKKLASAKVDTKKLIISEGTFGMDGDLAPLKKLVALSKIYRADLMVDDAHGIGVLGEQGRGTLEELNLAAVDVPILVGTFSKAFGGAGGFVLASKTMIETLIQFCRPYIYTTALPAAIAEAMQVSLKIIQQQPWRRVHCQLMINRFKKGALQLGLSLLPSNTPIQPILIGDPAKTVLLGKKLQDLSIDVGVIRAPTVPKGTDRLRITITAVHTEQQIDYLLEALSWIL